MEASTTQRCGPDTRVKGVEGVACEEPWLSTFAPGVLTSSHLTCWIRAAQHIRSRSTVVDNSMYYPSGSILSSVFVVVACYILLRCLLTHFLLTVVAWAAWSILQPSPVLSHQGPCLTPQWSASAESGGHHCYDLLYKVRDLILWSQEKRKRWLTRIASLYSKVML